MVPWELSGLIPVGLSMIAMYFWLVLRPRWKGVRPVKDCLLRSPGESLRLKLEDFDEKLMNPIFGLIFSGLLIGLVTAPLARYSSGELRLHLLIGTWSIGTMGVVLSFWWLIQVCRTRANYDLGFSAERAVGEELNLLMLDGYRVFHDFPAGNWNIDHIIIGPSGVYAVETKGRRKRKAMSGDNSHRVIFDGKSLHFGKRKETSALDQAERNARWLSESLSKAVAEPIQVQPILTIPGWFVDRRGRGKVTVLNHREFKQAVVRNGSPALTPHTIERIVQRIDEKCRDVKF